MLGCVCWLLPELHEALSLASRFLVCCRCTFIVNLVALRFPRVSCCFSDHRTTLWNVLESRSEPAKSLVVALGDRPGRFYLLFLMTVGSAAWQNWARILGSLLSHTLNCQGSLFVPGGPPPLAVCWSTAAGWEFLHGVAWQMPGLCIFLNLGSVKSVPAYRSWTCEIPKFEVSCLQALVQVIQVSFPPIAHKVGCMLSLSTTNSS